MARHVIQISALTILAIFAIFYPFLPGTYDSAALGWSTLVQLFEVVGLLLVPLGVVWALYEMRKQIRGKKNLPGKNTGYRFALSALIIASILLTPISLLILFGIGISFGLLALSLWLSAILGLRPGLRSLKETEGEGFNPAPLYLIFIPLVVLVAQLLLARPATEFSRNYAIANSAELIGDIEQYHTAHGRYPEALLAVWKDYYPDVIGVEKFNYVPHEGTYNLYFEQPRLLFDNIGTREFVVYNPSDEHLMLSHTSWFIRLTPEELKANQGWYMTHNADSPHWKYFWFD